MTCLAIRLQGQLKVPVGIIVRAISSSPSGAWLERSAIDKNKNIQAQINAYKRTYTVKYREYEAAMSEWKQKKRGRKPRAPVRPGYEMQSWFKTDIDSRGKHYKNYIQPIIPYAIRGFIWDQGESGTGIASVRQGTITSNIVYNWRQHWGDDKLPFYYFNKKQYSANFKKTMAQVKNCSVITTKELRQELHPADKDAYAQRAFEIIMKKSSNNK